MQKAGRRVRPTARKIAFALGASVRPTQAKCLWHVRALAAWRARTFTICSEAASIPPHPQKRLPRERGLDKRQSVAAD